MSHSVMLIIVIAAVMLALRFTPFILFKSDKTPDVIMYLGGVLPCAIMGMLVVYCLKNVSLISAPHGIPEAIAIAFVALTYLWKKNTLASIALGTVLYMFLVQKMF